MFSRTNQMLCNNAENCTYYRTHRYKTTSKQYLLLVESYCEGSLQSMCQRIRYENEFDKEAPAHLAPNGYVIGTHKKIKTENTRQFARHKVENGTCLLQVMNTPKTFSALVNDISEGGMQLELSISPQDLNICSEKNLLKVLGHSIEESPLPLSSEVLKLVWQNQQVVGCSFVTPPTP